MQAPPLPRYLIPRLPFFYGWVVLGCICLAGFARQGPAGAVLSIFVVPMTDAFGWSRTEMSGAVSLGGVLAAIISPMVGTLYTAASPEAPAFIAVGQKVAPDTVVCIIEAMKVMNEIKAEVSGTITEVAAENGQPVQFGQALFRYK